MMNIEVRYIVRYTYQGREREYVCEQESTAVDQVKSWAHRYRIGEMTKMTNVHIVKRIIVPYEIELKNYDDLFGL